MRTSGILLHISSLPSPYGIGTLGKEAYEFVDFLVESGQSIWQILPIGPTSYGDSPYASPSSFAFNPYFIDFDLLVKDKLLLKTELPAKDEGMKVNYGKVYYEKYYVLHKAYLRKDRYQKQFDRFKKANAEWLDDYARFMVLKNEHENRPWNKWYDDFRYKVDHAMEWFDNEYDTQIDEYKFYQFLFVKQWKKLKKYANEKGIKIMGDMPIYCAYDSCDVWSNPNYFQLDDRLEPTFVAGCPPDQFSEGGQLWGNPLYNYEVMEKDNYSWWVKRIKHSLKMFDILRIDHFRGFAGYFSIPYGDLDARGGHWVEGPGYKLFKAVKMKCRKANIVAENLGHLTPDVFELLKKCKYPGMNIAQFELNGGNNSHPILGNYPTNNIMYTGTHDNQTIISFYHSLNEADRKLIDEACNIGFMDRPELKIVEFCMNKNCDYCIVPLQDYLGLPDDIARMNTPSTASGNWGYRCRKMNFTPELAKFIKELTIKSNRIN